MTWIKMKLAGNENESKLTLDLDRLRFEVFRETPTWVFHKVAVLGGEGAVSGTHSLLLEHRKCGWFNSIELA